MPSGPCLKDVFKNTDASGNQTGRYRPCQQLCERRQAAEMLGEGLIDPNMTDDQKRGLRRNGAGVHQSSPTRCARPD